MKRMTLQRLAVGTCLGLSLAMGASFVTSDASALCMRMPPGYFEAHSAMRRGDISEARRLFRQAASHKGQAAAWMAGAFSSAAWRAKSEGKLDEAVRLYRSALRENPQYTYGANMAVKTYEDAGRLHDALLEIRSLPKSIARSDEIRTSEARILEKLGDHAAAQRVRQRMKR